MKTDTGSWRVFINYKNTKKSKTFRTRAAGVAWGKDEERRIEFGITAPPKAPPSPRLSVLFGRYLREFTSMKRGQQPEASRLDTLRVRFGALTLAELSVEEVLDWVRERSARVNAETIRRDLAVLSSVCKAATVVWKHAGSNPVPEARTFIQTTGLLSAKVNRRRRLEPGEYKRLLRGLRETPIMRDVVRFIIETGLRRSEVTDLLAGRLRFDGVYIDGDKTQTNDTIPMSSRARRILLRYPDGFPMRPDSISQAFRRACKREGIVGLRLHDLRREATSRFFEMGLAAPEVMMITRHKNLKTLGIYSRPRTGDVSRKLG